MQRPESEERTENLTRNQNSVGCLIMVRWREYPGSLFFYFTKINIENRLLGRAWATTVNLLMSGQRHEQRKSTPASVTKVLALNNTVPPELRRCRRCREVCKKTEREYAAWLPIKSSCVEGYSYQRLSVDYAEKLLQWKSNSFTESTWTSLTQHILLTTDGAVSTIATCLYTVVVVSAHSY